MSEPAAKRARIEGPSLVGIEKAIFECLAEVWQSVKSMSVKEHEKVEIEVRVGMLHARRGREVTPGAVATMYRHSFPAGHPNFMSGVDASMIQTVRKALSSLKYVPTSLPLQRLRFNEARGLRLEIGGAEDRIKTEKKTKFCTTDLGCSTFFYDLRVDAAIEEIVPPPPPDERVTWQTERHKSRTTFRSSFPGSFWHVDLTEVETFVIGEGKSTTSIELEFEMNTESMLAWLTCEDNNEILSKTKGAAAELHGLICELIPGHREVGIELSQLKKPDETARQNINSRVSEMKEDQRGNNFLGSMPVNLKRRNFSSIRQKHYFVTEKSDGLRFLLYVVNGAVADSGHPPRPIAVLMDRSGELFLLPGAHTIGQALGVGTILDGELVFNLSFRLNVFLVFDVLSLDRVAKWRLPFRERLEFVRESVSRCSCYINEHWETRDSPNSPTILIRKDFLPKNELHKLLSKVVEQNGFKVFHDTSSSGRRHHCSDGVILQPADTPYVFGTDTNLLKWKWPELISVDLAVMRTADNCPPKLLAIGPDNVYIDCARQAEDTANSIGKFDLMRLYGDLSVLEAKGRRVSIAEFAYDTGIGIWKYLHFREDKTVPNNINTVLNVLMEQAESVSAEELQFRLLASSEAESDYQVQLGLKLGELLAFQRARTTGGRK